MRQKVLITATILFFLLFNTTYFWLGKLGYMSLFGILAMVICFVMLGLLMMWQVVMALKGKFADSQRNVVIGLMMLVLGLAFYYPLGIINFDELEGDNLLVAQRKGSANIMTTLKFKDNNTFIQRTVGFGWKEITGEYRISGDTLILSNISYGRDSHAFFERAIIRNVTYEDSHSSEYLELLYNEKDTVGPHLRVIKNVLSNGMGVKGNDQR